MSSYPIVDIEGIGPKCAAMLKEAGITTTEDLLKACKTPADRKKVAADSGCDEKAILRWANCADLMRIKGVGEEYSDLLEAAGVDTVKELATRVPENLAAKMVEVNASKKLVRREPSEDEVKDWVAHAKKLAPMLEY